MTKILLTGWLGVASCCSLATAQSSTLPAIDSVLACIQNRIATCDSSWNDMTMVATIYERKLDGNGRIKNEVITHLRIHRRGEQQREFLEDMWKNGERVSPEKLAKEIAKREKKRIERSKQDHQKGGLRRITSGGPHLRNLEPFRTENSEDYSFPEMRLDTIHGVEVLRITVEPKVPTSDLLRGTAWVDRSTFDPCREEYAPARNFGPIKEMTMRIQYDDGNSVCALPRTVDIHIRGRAYLFFKFNIEIAVSIDSVYINPGLPDSLFEIVAAD